jgi:CheY-like chemotaxis protein
MDLQVKVLIVEDDSAMAQMCAKLIRRRGYSVLIAGSGHDALAIVRGGDIDVVLSDVHMPQMSGAQLLSGLRALDATLPIIVMTGYTQLLSPSEAEALGASDYLMKPFEPDTLICSLQKALSTR